MIKSALNNIQWDWSINIGNIITLVAFMLAGVGAWYDLKSDVKLHQIRLDAFDKVIEVQLKKDVEQDAGIEKRTEALRMFLREENRDIKAEIRDLRGDFMRAQRPTVSVAPNKPH